MTGLMRLGRVEQVIKAMDFGLGGGMVGSPGAVTVLACWGRVLGSCEDMVVRRREIVILESWFWCLEMMAVSFLVWDGSLVFAS